MSATAKLILMYIYEFSSQLLCLWFIVPADSDLSNKLIF